MSDHIVQEHKHILTMQFKDGRWVKCCINHECDYEEENELPETQD